LARAKEGKEGNKREEKDQEVEKRWRREQ